MKAAIYAYSKNKENLDHQLEKCREFCKQRGFEIKKEYCDFGGPNRYAGKKELKKFLKECENYDCLVVFSNDRVTRDFRDAVDIDKTLAKNKVKVYPLNQKDKGGNVMGREGLLVPMSDGEKEIMGFLINEIKNMPKEIVETEDDEE